MLSVAICDDDPAICRLLERMIAQVNRQRPVVEEVDMDLVDGDGKQQFTVEIRSLVDSICDKTGSVLSLFR